MTEPIPRVMMTSLTRSSAQRLCDDLNTVAKHSEYNYHDRYYTVERRWPFWQVHKHYMDES